MSNNGLTQEQADRLTSLNEQYMSGAIDRESWRLGVESVIGKGSSGSK